MTITDAFLIAATATSPFLAVQAQQTIERLTARRNAKEKIFKVLMATRATPIAVDHVQALNMIDIEFAGAQKPKDRAVIDAWKIYADHLNNPGGDEPAAINMWYERGRELFTDLLYALSNALGYSFDRVQLRRGVYYPRAHGEAEERKRIFEEAIIKILTGQTALPMKVTEFPFSPEPMNFRKKFKKASSQHSATTEQSRSTLTANTQINQTLGGGGHPPRPAETCAMLPE
jgi:hypothetical protein